MNLLIPLKASIKMKMLFVLLMNNRGKLQGVAFVDLTRSLGYDNVLDEVLVNPERNSAIGKRAAIKGTGTKLVQAVANKVLMKKGEQNLGLLSLKSAIPFYIKLGFDDNGGGPGANNGPMTEDMSMNAKQMKMLCAKV
ncbi:MAG: GNAT family N-acetyltransferase [Parachlamydiaceae bacterium]|nr:GNAT family N-acetyltransferase [Parachlamydiaceae bacterium]